MPTLYATEPVMHDGQTYLPGDEINCDANDGASIIGSGRGTLDANTGKAAKKQYNAAQKAAATDESAPA